MAKKFSYRPHPNLYEINTIVWLNDLGSRLGKTVRLGDVPAEEWDRFKKLGMDFVWLMGVWQRSAAGREIILNHPRYQIEYKQVLPDYVPDDVAGSPYAVSAYEPDPLVGTPMDLRVAKKELNKRGIGLILDFVPNHTAADHGWVTEHPDYYIQGSEAEYRQNKGNYFPVETGKGLLYIAHGRDPNFPPWTDTAQLDYYNPELRAAMIEQVAEIAPYCDGLRCDMVMLCMNSVFCRIWPENNNGKDQDWKDEFWPALISANPGLIYIAEAYWDTEWQLQQMGFDFTYDKRLYDRLLHSKPHEIYLHLTAGMDFQNKLVRFIENHDEQRSISVFPNLAITPVAALYSTLPGMRFFHDGQLEGRRVKVPVQIKRAPQERTDNLIYSLYEKLLPVINTDIFHSGEWRLKTVYQELDKTADNLIAHVWKTEGILQLVIINLTGNPSEGRIDLCDDIDESEEYRWKELFTGRDFNEQGKIMAHPGLSFSLAAYQAMIWEINRLPEN